MSAAIKIDLCRGSIYGASFIRDEGAYERTGIPANYFTCAHLSNGFNIFPCTGSEHRHGVEYACTCQCHEVALARADQ